MDWNNLAPAPPRWALKAGLDRPRKDEGFADYVSRLGITPGRLTHDLTEQTAELANIRLRSFLARTMEPYFNAHVRELVEKHITPERRRELRPLAEEVSRITRTNGLTRQSSDRQRGTAPRPLSSSER